MSSPEFNMPLENNDGYTNKRSGGKDQRPQREAYKANAGKISGSGGNQRTPEKK